MVTLNPLLLPRRRLLAASLLSGLGMRPALAALPMPLVFPRDAGAHSDFATEWWYVTGYANSTAMEAAYGFQITFFRSRIAKTQAMQSRLAARQLYFAHAAVTDVQGRSFWHDQRVARASGEPPGANPLDTAWSDTQDTAVRLRDWSLSRRGTDLQARIHSTDFSLDLLLTATQPVLLQGEQGLSRKGPQADAASYYYSLPHLRVQGELTLRGQRLTVGAGSTAWLDHEWSQAYMPSGAVGWDWIGINLSDGSALMAFRMRDKTGAALWDGGAFRAKGAAMVNFQHGELEFKPLRLWKSPASQASYPVEWLVRTPTTSYTVRALLNNQEMDSRTSTGGIYWEGLCEVLDSNRRPLGHGYLEMTGYASPLQM